MLYHGTSIGSKSGKYGDKYFTLAPAFSIIFPTPFVLWALYRLAVLSAIENILVSSPRFTVVHCEQV